MANTLFDDRQHVGAREIGQKIFERNEAFLEFSGACGFRKIIHHEIYNLTTTSTDANTGVVTQLSVPENAGHSSLTGAEFSGTWQDFTALSPWLAGVGLRAPLSARVLAGAVDAAAKSVARVVIAVNESSTTDELARAAVQRALTVPLHEGLKIEADLSTLAYRTKDAAEGIAAFCDKRPPRFRDA